MSLAYLWRHPTNNNSTVSNRSFEVASSAADNAILKIRAQNIECSFGCVACSAVLLKPNVANILLFNFCEQKFIQHGPIAIAIACIGLSLLIFEEKCSDYASGPKSTPNSDLFRMRRLFNVCVRFFVPQMRQFCLFTYSPRSKWASQYFAYTQPYSFGGRIKLIICQIGHELRVTIHEISTSWKKTLEGGPYTRLQRLLVISSRRT